MQKGKGSTASPPAVANRGQQPSQRGPTPPSRGQEDYSPRNSQGYPQQGPVPQMMFAPQSIMQQNQQQGQPRMTPFFSRGMSRPMRMSHPQTANQPMYQSPPPVGVQPMIQMSGGGPTQYSMSPQFPQVDYQTVPVPNQPMPYRSPAPQVSGGYNQVQYSNYSPSASMPPPMYVTQQPIMFVRGAPQMPQNIPAPQQYQQTRTEQQQTVPRKKKLINIKDPNQDNKDVTVELLLSSGNASGSPSLSSESNVSGQSSSSNTPPQENASVSKNSESLGSVFAAQVAATLNDGGESKKTKETIPQATPSQTTKTTSPKAIHSGVKVISISNPKTIEKDSKKEELKADVGKTQVRPTAMEGSEPKKVSDTVDNAISAVDGAKVSIEAASKNLTEVKMENQINANAAKPSIQVSTEAASKNLTEVKMENQINANAAKLSIPNETVTTSTPVDSKAVAETESKKEIVADTSPSKKTISFPVKEQEKTKVEQENLPNGSISPLTVNEEIVLNTEISQDLEMAPLVEDIPKSDTLKDDEISKVQTEGSKDIILSITVESAGPTQVVSEEGKVNGAESESKAKQAASTMDSSMKEHKRKKLNKRMKEIDKKPDQADLMDAYTEAPTPKEEVKEEAKEEKKEPQKEQEEQVASEEETWEDKDEKSEGIWSPEPEAEENKNGPRFYDRDFLLQFQFNPLCTEKPEGLPDIEVVLQTPVTHRPQMKQPFPNRMGSSGGIDFMMPSYMRQPRGGPGQSGQSMARNKGRVPAKKVIHAIEQKVELSKSENRWVRPSEVEKTLSEEEKKTHEIIRKFRGILNKLTPQKFGTLIQQVLDLEIDTPKRLEDVIDIIFEKAISEPNFSVAYANMCRQLLHTNVKVETKDGKDTTLTFRKILLNKCQKEFEKEKSDEINIHEKMDELLKQGLSEEELKVKKEELDQEELKGRRRTLGNIRFIGELFKLKMLTESIMHDCIIKLLKSNDEESYECLCKLLSTIGKDLDHPKAKPRMDQYFEQINKIIEAKKTSSRCRFMLQDVRDLRESNWVPRRDDNNPKTIDQIHKEAAEEEKKMMMIIQQSKLHKRDGPGKGRDGPRTVVPQADETWTTVPGRPRNINVDPKKFQNVQKRTNVDTESISLGPGGRGYGAWARGSSGGSGPASGPSTPTEEPRGNRFSALGDGRRGAGASRQGSGAGRQESRSQGPPGRRPQSEREKALEAVRIVVQTKPAQQTKQDERQTVSPQPDDGEVESEALITRQPAAPTPPPKELTEEEVESKTMGLIDEYHNIKDLKEAIQCVKDINSPGLHYKFVSLALNHSMEKHASERVLTARLMHALLQNKVITEESYIKGLEEILEFAEDMEIDIPHIWKYLGELIGTTIINNVLSLISLNKSVEKLVRDKPKAAKLMAEVLISARSRTDPKEIDHLWSQSGLCFSNFFSSREDAAQFLKSNNLESLASFASSSGPQPHSSKVQEELQNLLLIKQSSNEDIFKWIDDNVKDPKDPKFVRALVRVVCEGCKKECDDSCDTFVFKQRSPLLQKYIDNNSSLALHALFALQALSVRLDHPPGFLKSFFNVLYDEEVIMEDAFFAWEEDKSPNESQGKGTAKSSTVHFFEWLRSAEEEKTDDS